jgi:(S)-citramalyl-CoA lyase
VITSKFMVIGGREEDLEPAFSYPADVICVDLEDTVPPDRKEAMRAALKPFIAQGRRLQRKTAVRISPLSTFDGLQDLLLMQQLDRAPDMVVLAKPQSPQEVAVVRDLLQPVMADIHLQAIVETAAALACVEQIASVPGLGSISLGGKDLSESLRVNRSWESLLYARSRCAAAAAAAGIPIVDGPQSRDTTANELRGLCVALRSLGYAGKSAVFPEHLDVINGIWSPGQPLAFA